MAAPENEIHVQFSDDRKHIRRWSFEPFDGSQFYALVCDCIDAYGEAPECPLHGLGTQWAAENPA